MGCSPGTHSAVPRGQPRPTPALIFGRPPERGGGLSIAGSSPPVGPGPGLLRARYRLLRARSVLSFLSAPAPTTELYNVGVGAET